MTPRALLSERLRSHRLTAPARTIGDAAAHMLAVQSQEFLAGRWALGIRTAGSPALSAVDRAFASGELVRSWTMRGTLHIVPAADLRWVLSVTGERQRRQVAGRHRELGIDAEVLSRVAASLRPKLADGGRTRAQLLDDIAELGIDPSAQRGVHIIGALCVDTVLVQGPVVARDDAVGREQLFVLADAHLRTERTPDDPLAELFVRYIDGHGPAGAADFAWWSGLTLGSAREAVVRAGDRVAEVDDGLFVSAERPRRRRGADDDEVRALPMFDEYYISYADRGAVADAEAMATIGPGKNGMVRASLLARGRIAGAWTHSAAVGRHRDVPVAEVFDETLDEDAVAAALSRYSAFVSG
ncbi:winged helix DNA-binding domain-containing protein [Streptomyces sp. AC495_CC817]|uniref:winged helix DNA-binding domain-containing protein n=1 Tax=Streptomyces sp. AC495_CC817 TaxID=2823900 RepID=UPI001C274296|nr:winged helix DNA-binding domain-containing protein [Streptomyces sp. AC495_CC817]